MPSINRLPPYAFVGAALLMITLYHVYNIRTKNADLERNLKVFKEALSVSKEKNKVLVKDALEKIDLKMARITELEKEGLMKHTALGKANQKLADFKSKLEMKNEDIKDLHELAAVHKGEIATLSKSVSNSKEVLSKLSEKAGHLMSDHTKMRNENILLQQQNEQLKNDIKKQQSEKKTLDEQLNTSMKEKQDLGQKVLDLTKKDEIIQESVRQKIKESYAARRRKTPSKRTLKETEDEQSEPKTSKDYTGKVSTNEQGLDHETPITLASNSETNQSEVVMVNETGFSDNSDNIQENVSKYMVNNSETAQNQNVAKKNVSKYLVENFESREKRDVIHGLDTEITEDDSRAGGNLNEEKLTNKKAEGNAENEDIDKQSLNEEQLTDNEDFEGNADGNIESNADSRAGEDLNEELTNTEDGKFDDNAENENLVRQGLSPEEHG